MSVTPLRKWEVTGLEIALDLEMPRLLDPSRIVFNGLAEPRICLVAGFALTSQLKRIVAAVDRAVPVRLPSGLRISPGTPRFATAPVSQVISIQPMLALLRLQSKLIQAIEPGLAQDVAPFRVAGMEETTVRFIADFVSRRTLPTFEPQYAGADSQATGVVPIGLTIYRLERTGAPESILAHWAYPQDFGGARLRGER